MKKFLHSDWLRAVQFFFLTVQFGPLWARAILLVFEKFTRAYLSQITLKIM